MKWLGRWWTPLGRVLEQLHLDDVNGLSRAPTSEATDSLSTPSSTPSGSGSLRRSSSPHGSPCSHRRCTETATGPLPLCPGHDETIAYRRTGNSSIPWHDYGALIDGSPYVWSPVVNCAGCEDHLNAFSHDQLALKPADHHPGQPGSTEPNLDLAHRILRVNNDLRCFMR